MIACVIGDLIFNYIPWRLYQIRSFISKWQWRNRHVNHLIFIAFHRSSYCSSSWWWRGQLVWAHAHFVQPILWNCHSAIIQTVKKKPHNKWWLRSGTWSRPSLKLTQPLKISLPKRKVVFQPWIFRGYVSFREGKVYFPFLIYVFHMRDHSAGSRVCVVCMALQPRHHPSREKWNRSASKG